MRLDMTNSLVLKFQKKFVSVIKSLSFKKDSKKIYEKLLNVQTPEVIYSFELRKKGSCSLLLDNKTKESLDFEVKTTNPKEDLGLKGTGTIWPGSTHNFKVNVEGYGYSDMKSKDTLILQDVSEPKLPNGVASKDIPEVPRSLEEPKEKSSEVPRSLDKPKEKPSKALSKTIAKLTKENKSVIQQNEKLRQELELYVMVSKLTEEKSSIIQGNQKLDLELVQLRKEPDGVSFACLVVIGLLCMFLGSLLRKSLCTGFVDKHVFLTIRV